MLRSLARTSTPALPVSLAEARLAARIDTTDLDGHVAELLAAAVEQAEHDTDRQLSTATYRLTLDAWPAVAIELPRPPLVSVESIEYYDQAGVLRTLAADQYTVDTAPRLGRVLLAPGAAWPGVQTRADAIRIAYTAGYGTADQVPAGLKVAIKKLVSHWFHQPAGDVPAEIARIFQAYWAGVRS